MKGRTFSKFLLGLVLVVAVGAAWFFLRRTPPQEKVRCVILISIDTCRADYLSCYGCPVKTTPNIDAFAAEGILFENVISPAPITLPAHSSMLTGTLPPYHSVHDNFDYRLGQNNVTLGEIMRQNGYRTGAIVGAFVMDSQFGLDQGFDSYNDRLNVESKAVLIPERKGEEVSRYALKWLEEHHREPFFLFLHYFDPHMPYDPQEPFASTFRTNRYAGEIAYADYCIGQVIGKLRELGLYDSALIIITSDHGEMLGEHGEPNHSYFIYQSAIKVPMIFKLPGQQRAKRIKELVGIIDIVPTVCGLLGIKPLSEVHGDDLCGYFWEEEASQRKRYMYCESFCPTKYKANSLLGVVSQGWKYIQTTRPELYDLVKDPREANNLIRQQPQQGHILQERLKQILEQSVSKDRSGSNIGLDEQSGKRLESLGYVSGRVKEDFKFDQSKDDPKDWINFHSDNAYVFELLAQKKYAEAEALCQKMLSERPVYEGSYMHLSKIAEEQGDKEKAITYLIKAIEVTPNHVQVRNKLGAMLVAEGRVEEAIEQFSESVRIGPEQFGAHNSLGRLFQLQGRAEEATSYYRRALQFNPDATETHNNLGNVLMSQGNLEEAIIHFARAVQLNPDSASAHYILARALTKSGKAGEAIKHFKEALRLEPGWVMPMNSLAWLLATHYQDEFRNPEEAVRLAERACELTNYKDAGRVDTLAAAYAAAGRFTDAVATAEKAVSLAVSTNNKERVEKIQNRLELYRQKKTYRQPSYIENGPE